MGVFTEHVVPIFGNILACIMLVSPFPAVLRLRASGKLGDTNPLPYVMTAVNGAGWIAYGFAIRNGYIFPANVVGFLAGIFFTLTAFGCAPKKVQDRITTILVAAAAHIILMGLLTCFALSHEAGARLWGTSAVVILMIYYFVPLSTMFEIVRTKNASTIYWPLAAGAVANGLMWTVYGFAVMDINLWLPNGFGAIIGVVQLLLRLVYDTRTPQPSSPTVALHSQSSDEEAGLAKAKYTAGAAERVDSGTNLLGPAVAASHTASNGIGNGIGNGDEHGNGHFPLAPPAAGPVGRRSTAGDGGGGGGGGRDLT